MNVIPSINILSNTVHTDCDLHLITLDNFELSTLTEGTEYILIDSTSGISQVLVDNSFKLITGGSFDLIQIKDGEIIQSDNDWITLPQLPICSEVISPNGDGINDSYYFEETGVIQIFSKSGILVKELNGPVVWEVVDKTGKLVESGLYLISLPDGKYRSLSILY